MEVCVKDDRIGIDLAVTSFQVHSELIIGSKDQTPIEVKTLGCINRWAVALDTIAVKPVRRSVVSGNPVGYRIRERTRNTAF